MCCQPPSSADDLEFYFQNNCRIIEASAPFNYSQIALTGGEPTLLGTRLIPFIQYLQTKFPETTVHLLSNGRSFANAQYTKLFEDIDKEKLLIGIPLHSDYSGDHDMITQIKGSFSETMLGLYQLAAINIDIELRILIHKINWKRLPEIANFIYKNLPFVNFVAFMGMEYIGNAIQNHDLLWVDPYEYQKELEEATALELPTLEQNLPVVATLTTLGTLMGLLGTVIGMIKSFAALANAGSPDSVALSAGISEALVNTAFGIATAVLALISYNYFTSKIDKLTYSIDEVGFTIVQTYAATHK